MEMSKLEKRDVVESSFEGKMRSLEESLQGLLDGKVVDYEKQIKSVEDQVKAMEIKHAKDERIAKFLDNNNLHELTALNDINKTNAMNLLKILKNNSPKLMGLSDLIKKCDLIIESASRDVVAEILRDRNLDNKNKNMFLFRQSEIHIYFQLI